MEKKTPELRQGLRDVIAGQTKLCLLDEANQRLYYRGYAIEDLAAHSTFEEVVRLLILGELPSRSPHYPHVVFEEILEPVFKTLRAQPREANPMDVLATLIRAYGNALNFDVEVKESEARNRDLAHIIPLVGITGYLAGVMSRWYEGRRPMRMPRVYGKTAQNILYQMLGREPADFETRAMDLSLILYAEHEFNASTFAVRVAASAHTDVFSAIVAGIGTLRGTRHGGANETAMKMMREIGSPDRVREFCDRFFEKAGARLPGFGHAVYTRGDPRTAILKPIVRELSEQKGDMRWYEIGLALEEYMRERAQEKGRGIPANVDLWTAPLYYLLGIPIPMYTPLFAASRVAGWCAHYLEARHELREPIIRPRAEYIGPAPRPFPPVKKEHRQNK